MTNSKFAGLAALTTDKSLGSIQVLLRTAETFADFRSLRAWWFSIKEVQPEKCLGRPTSVLLLLPDPLLQQSISRELFSTDC